jgi:hypothetical protein
MRPSKSEGQEKPRKVPDILQTVTECLLCHTSMFPLAPQQLGAHM